MANLNPEVPRKTADICTLPDGDQVWVQTLNSLLKQDCSRAANRFAMIECADFAAGGALRPALVRQVKAMTPEDQATVLADEEYRMGSILRVLDAEFPPIPEPERGDLNDDAFMTLYKEWQAKDAKREEERTAKEEELYEKERQKALGMPAKARIDACVSARVSREFQEAFIRRFVVEELFRAVRTIDDHSQRYFASIDALEGVDDETLVVLRTKYREIDSVLPEEVPISPAG